jgi:hypothetical protein
MATAALLLGIVSLLFCTFFYVSLPCGALSVICAILSRKGTRMSGKSKVGLTCGAAGMAATIVITVSMAHTVLTDPQMRAYMQQYIRIYIGDSSFDLDKALEEMLPFLHFSDGDDTDSADETESETDPASDRVYLTIAPKDEDRIDTESESELQSDTEAAPESESESEAEPAAEHTKETEPAAESESTRESEKDRQPASERGSAEGSKFI